MVRVVTPACPLTSPIRSCWSILYFLQNMTLTSTAILRRTGGPDVSIGDALPADLIDRVSRPMQGGKGRPAIFDADLRSDLLELMRMRHRARDAIYDDFDASKAGPSVEAAKRVLSKIRDAIAGFKNMVIRSRPTARRGLSVDRSHSYRGVAISACRRPVDIQRVMLQQRPPSHVDVGAERIVLDELAARFNHVAHQLGEDVVGLVNLLDLHLQQRARIDIERGFPELLRIHLAESFVEL